MARSHTIGGVRFHRRHLVKLDADERARLSSAGRAVLRRPVEWPLEGRTPDFSRAYVDEGGTDLWGPGPYLKVPNRPPGGDESINRVFCPWGYPPDRVRIARRGAYLRLAAVGLERVGAAEWAWLLAVVPWEPDPTGDASPGDAC